VLLVSGAGSVDARQGQPLGWCCGPARLLRPACACRLVLAPPRDCKCCEHFSRADAADASKKRPMEQGGAGEDRSKRANLGGEAAEKPSGIKVCTPPRVAFVAGARVLVLYQSALRSADCARLRLHPSGAPPAAQNCRPVGHVECAHRIVRSVLRSCSWPTRTLAQ
jgi:hypothetical protein